MNHVGAEVGTADMSGEQPIAAIPQGCTLTSPATSSTAGVAASKTPGRATTTSWLMPA